MLDEVREAARSSGTGRTRLLGKLAQLERAVTEEIENLEDARRRRVTGPRARVRAAIYTVEDSPRGDALTARRDREARPFKCPQAVYRAVTSAVASSAEPQGFQAIKAHAQRMLKVPVADYAVRVPLRFWAVLGLVRHDQARFVRVNSKAEFTRNARDAWKRASSLPFEVRPD